VVDVDANAPIGVFDSGVGGLSVLRALWRELPGETFLFLADQAHVPYGPRSLEQVRGFSEGIARFLLAQRVKLIVVACNAASAAALHHLRATLPQTSFVGMEPAVKPASESTSSGVVGVLATPATFQGALYASVVERFANGVQLLQHTCPGLVNQIERGRLDEPETRLILEDALRPMLAQGIDRIVLGCTHYPFVIPQIESIVGEGVRVIDPAPAVARQVRRVLEQHSLIREPQRGEQVDPETRFLTSGDPPILERLLFELLGIRRQAERVTWDGEKLDESD
jgi:glutamate racemase